MHVGRVLEHNLRPFLEDGFRNVQLPVDFAEEGPFISVDLRNLESRHLAPRLRGVIAVLHILRCQDESREEHPPPTHQSAVSWTVHLLLLRKVIFGDEWLD